MNAAVKEAQDAANQASEDAKKASDEAQKAVDASKESVGFRTLFSAIRSGEDGNIDLSRPMLTNTSESVSIQSKGDRIQSVQVNGFTEQAGSGDPRPDNVREISTAGKKFVKITKITFDGSGDKNWGLSSGSGAGPTGSKRFSIVATIAAKNTSYTQAPGGYCTRLTGNTPNNTYSGYSGENAYSVIQESGKPYIQVRIANVSTLEALRQNLAANPITIWYEPSDESQATGLYIPVETQGHEYRCQMMELTAPLCDGDKVESCAPSGCDKKLTLDSSTENIEWNTEYQMLYITLPIPVLAHKFGMVLSDKWIAVATTYDFPGKGTIPAVSTAANLNKISISLPGVESVESYRQYMQENGPAEIYYKSAAYTEANDIPVQLETHVYNKMTFDGTEGFSYSEAGKSIYINLPEAAASQATSLMCSSYIGAWSGANVCNINSGKNLSFVGPYDSLEDGLSVLTGLAQAGTPVTLVYKLATPAVYAHDPVELVAVPYTEKDSGKTVGSYDVSSQSGTTIQVSLKALQDGGNAATLGGMTLEDIKKLISDAVTAAVTLAQGE